MAEFDYLVVGGGTAGCIVAARLAQDPAVSVGLIECGPSDEHEPRARSIRRWAEMLEGEYDLAYRPTSRPWPGPLTRPCTTSAAPAGWAPPATRSRCWTRRCGCAA